jgi:hypothetical protein
MRWLVNCHDSVLTVEDHSSFEYVFSRVSRRSDTRKERWHGEHGGALSCREESIQLTARKTKDKALEELHLLSP